MNKRKFLALLVSMVLALPITACSDMGEDMGGATVSSSSSDESQAESDCLDSEDESFAKEEVETEIETESLYVSPTETITTTLGSQLDVSVILDRDDDNTYQTSLADLIQDGDVPTSFTFVFYSGDNSSNIGAYKGGCGISVTDSCPSATSEYWYQSDDFSIATSGAYAEITWTVPSDIQNYIDANGDILIGYWWGNTATVRLANIICTYTRTVTIAVDGTETLTVGQNVGYNDTDNTLSVDVSDIVGDGTIQAVTYQISADSGFGKFTGACGISGADSLENIAILTDLSSLTVTWVVPDSIKLQADNQKVILGYWWGEVSTLCLESITIKYSVVESSNAFTSKSTTIEMVTDNTSSFASSSAWEIVNDIKIGWNLGNTLDCYSYETADAETAWGNPTTTKAMIDTVKNAGFNAVRIPISWTDHISNDGTIDSEWLDRVQEVVDYCMDNDLYTIINMHHDDYTWFDPTYANQASITATYQKIWEQIAERFKDYDTHLLFEGMNEPRIVGSSTEWTGGTQEEYDVINAMLAVFVETVRNSGGNNTERTLIVTTQAASITSSAVSGLVLPDDNNIIVSIHAYMPWKFTDADYEDVSTWQSSYESELTSSFQRLYDTFISQGVPVIIGEFGAVDKENTSDRVTYYSTYVSLAQAYGIKCFVWDNGISDGGYGLLDRKNLAWYYSDIITAIMNALG